MFNRIIIQELKQWRAKKDRKPLIMLGARQVGKTSVLQKFGEEYFELAHILVSMKKRESAISFARPRTRCKSSSNCHILLQNLFCLRRLCLFLMRYKTVRKPLAQ